MDHVGLVEDLAEFLVGRIERDRLAVGSEDKLGGAWFAACRETVIDHQSRKLLAIQACGADAADDHFVEAIIGRVYRFANSNKVIGEFREAHL